MVSFTYTHRVELSGILVGETEIDFEASASCSDDEGRDWWVDSIVAFEIGGDAKVDLEKASPDLYAKVKKWLYESQDRAADWARDDLQNAAAEGYRNGGDDLAYEMAREREGRAA